MIGERFKGRVRDISIEGYGVVDHPEKFVFFVLGTFPGDEGTFEVVHVKKRYGYARLIEMHTYAEDRVEGPCPHAGIREGLCGGCPWMSLEYTKQLLFKHHMLTHALKRDRLIADDFQIEPIWPSPQIFGFRNRAQFKTDGTIMGYVSRFSRVIAPIKDCHVLNTNLRILLQDALASLPMEAWTPTPPHGWSYIDIDDEAILSDIVPNRRRPFRQGNSQQNEQMKAWVKEKTAHWQGGSAIELFCGSGNFTTILANQGIRQFAAVDIASEGIRRLRAKLPEDQCTVIEANMFKPSDWKLLKNHIQTPDFLFLDPPRDGFSKLDMFVSQWNFPREILYISCNLDTFTNDVGRLKKKGYSISDIVGLDQFPHTPHIEILSVLKRQ